MTAPEVNVEIVNPPVDDAATSGAPEIVVVEAPANSGGTDPGTILSLELLAERIVNLERERDESIARFESVNIRLDGHSERIVALEYDEIEVPEETGEIVTEVIPPAATEIEAEIQPVARKRRFI
jgi:hypothetical protein